MHLAAHYKLRSAIRYVTWAKAPPYKLYLQIAINL